jgi:tRNA nucleotidyltransferase/poly(A) polymerase
MTGVEAARLLLASSRLRQLGQAGIDGQTFLTGGSLRDRLLGLPTHDLDLAVTGDPRVAGETLAAHFGGSCFPLGRAPLVTWRVRAGRHQIDVWGITGAIEEDILRRDFTVNAMLWRLPRGPLLDLVGGLDDLAAGRLRVVRPENLRDDPLRVLRGIRLFATHPQLRLTSETERFLAAAARGLAGVAGERVCDELRTLLAGRAVARALAVAVRIGVLQVLVPAWNGYAHTSEAAALAGELAARQAGCGAFARGAADVAPAVLAAPAAGFPHTWDDDRAATALTSAGWPARAAAHATVAAALGERLAAVLGRDRPAERALVAGAGDLIEGALAWALARGAAEGRDLLSPAAALLRWQRRFSARPPLLSGAEIVDLLALPPGPARGDAVRALRLAQARGEVRTAAQARRRLAPRSAR